MLGFLFLFFRNAPKSAPTAQQSGPPAAIAQQLSSHHLHSIPSHLQHMQGHLLSIAMRATGVTTKGRSQHIVGPLVVGGVRVVNRPCPGRAGLDQLSRKASMKNRCSRGGQNPGLVRAGVGELRESLRGGPLRLAGHTPVVGGGNGGLGWQ